MLKYPRICIRLRRAAAGPIAIGITPALAHERSPEPATVVAGDGLSEATQEHPTTARYVSLRATTTDAVGNEVRQAIIHAYRLTSEAS
jgi:hypothetical protein